MLPFDLLQETPTEQVAGAIGDTPVFVVQVRTMIVHAAAAVAKNV